MSEALPPPLPVEPVEASNRVWGFWASFGFGLVIFCGFLSAHVVATIPYVVFLMAMGREIRLEELVEDGLALALGTCVAAPVIVSLAWVLSLARRGLPPKDYLALNKISLGTVLRWSIVLLLFVAVSDGLTSLLGRPIVPEVMIRMYRSAQFKPLLWLAIIIMAPIGEEMLFRGFLFRGFERSRLGNWGTIALTSALWAAIHSQYDAYGIATIFVGGLLLGYARMISGSVLLTIFLHAMMNFIATVQVEVLVRMAATGG